MVRRAHKESTIAPAIRALRDAIVARLPRAIVTVWDAPEHRAYSPFSPHDSGNALDIMRTDRRNLKAIALSLASDDRVHRIIIDGRIFEQGSGWSDYRGPDKHRWSVHIEVREAARYDKRPWAFTLVTARSADAADTTGLPALVTSDLGLIVTVADAPLYASPGSTSYVIRTMPLGTVLSVPLAWSGRWVKAVAHHTAGWVRSEHVKAR